MLSGSIVALITPFLNNEIDYNKLKELIDFQIKNNTPGLLILGTTAETSTLTTNEKQEIAKYTIEYVNGRTELLIGVCENDTYKTISNCKYYESLGYINFLIISPYYNQTNVHGLLTHFTTIAKNIKGNVVIYNIPNRTNISIPFDTIKTLSEIENITGIKESNPNIKESVKLFDLQSENFKIFCGNDELILPFLSLGVDGIINVCGNIIPKQINNIINLYKNNYVKPSRNLFNVYKQLIFSVFEETNPIGIKEAMFILNTTNKELRLPLCNMSTSHSNELRKELIKLGMYTIT